MKKRHGFRFVLLCGLLAGILFSGNAVSQAEISLETVSEQMEITRTKELPATPTARKTTKQLTQGTILVPGGEAVGIKLYTKGVMVVGFSELNTSGIKNPALKAGVRKGDVILAVNGTEVNSNEELAAQTEQAGEQPVELSVRRKGNTLTIKVTPVRDSVTGTLRLGLMVRDSTAGIGTLTYYDPTDGSFGSLGHGIGDADTGEILPLGRGTLEPVSITSVRKGKAGDPGELKGYFRIGSTLGGLTANLEEGLFGIGNGLEITGREAVHAASRKEIHTGPATIRCTVDEEGIKEYSIEIVRIYSAQTKTKNMLIRVTDPVLLEKTGGIVQGMSGSPILQNGKLIGAVTHVLVDDPTKGYAIFVENMLETAQSVAEEKLKEAS